MNILKVFNKAVLRNKIKKEFVTEYLKYVKGEDIYGTIKMHSGGSVYFRCVRSVEDAHLLSGLKFFNIEYYGNFHEDIIQYLNSRIRSQQ